MTSKYTIETLASGQPRPYADTIRHVRVTFEYFFAWLGNPKDPRSTWKNEHWTEDEVRKFLLSTRCGFTEHKTYELGKAKLDWLRETSPGVWEFHTTEPFTD